VSKSLIHIILIPLFLASFNTLAGYSCSPEDVKASKCTDLVKLNSAAALGQCLPDDIPNDIPSLFKKNNISVSTGSIPRRRKAVKNLDPIEDYSDPKVLALARVVLALDQIGNGKLKALKEGENIDVIFANKNSPSKNSRRFGSQIQIKGGTQNMTGTQHSSACQGMDNMGLHAHELGHYIAGNNDSKVLNDYISFMKGNQCRLTSYTTKNNSEEIAEVIAAYVTMPQAFLNKGESCNMAFNFMKNLFGEPYLTMSCQSRKTSYGKNANQMVEDMPKKRDQNPSRAVF
jgi:hypothetical protein